MGASPPEHAARSDRTAQWQTVWSQVYSKVPAEDRPDLRSVGWNDSTTGRPMSEGDVGEWADHTAHRILSRRPKRVLEIGCGNGILLRKIAPHCERYVGIDITAEAVRNIRDELAREPRKWSHVEVRQAAADEIESILLGGIDAVIINSVVQYFPNVEYALRVLQPALEKTAPGGFVFVGDVRSLPLLEAFHAWVELARAPGTLATSELRRNVQQSLHREKELVIDPEFFRALAGRVPAVSDVDIQLKRGRLPNELNRFRYDVTFRLLRGGGGPRSPSPVSWTDWGASGLEVAQLPQWLARQEGDSFGLAGIPNARVALELAALELIASPRPPATAAAVLGAARESARSAVDPEDLWNVAGTLPLRRPTSRGRVSIGVASTRPSCAAPRPPRVSEGAPAVRAGEASGSPPMPWARYANDPSLATRTRHLAREMRGFLRTRLPESMIPANFVAIERLPRTPGGKLDVEALAALEAEPRHRQHPHRGS